MATQVGPLAGVAIGRIFAERYQILELLGRGGMGAVYLADDREVGENVALKILEAHTEGDDSAVERFRREVRLARRVTHANAARTYDLGMCDGIRYLSMEYVTGRNLQDILQGTRFDSKQVASIALQLCAGLRAAHEAGVIHRDLKPENILIENDTGRVVITDFGIARALETEGDSMRTAGAIGTPAYMSPEQLECKLVDQRTDIYSLGLILYQLSTGVHPFLKSTPIATAMARLTDTPPAPAEICAVDSALSAVIMEALSRDPDERPQSVHDIAERLSATEAETFVPCCAPQAQCVASLPTEAKRIAIMPFRYRGPKEDEYLAEVLTEELVDIFSMTEGLCVVGPAASISAPRDGHGTGTNVLELSSRHDVEAVVVGTIQKAGEELRIAARLLESPSGRQIWSEHFNGKLDNVFDLQDRIAKRVAEALRIELVQSSLLEGVAPEAVEAYLRARHAGITGAFADLPGRAALLEHCLELEPHFKPALAALAQTRTTMWFMGIGDDARARAQEAVEKTLRLAPELAESHLAAGVFATNCADYHRAVRSLVRALEIAPTYGDAHDYLGQLQLEAGRPEEGIERVKLALALDPSRTLSLYAIAREHLLRGDTDAYEQVLARYRRVDSNYSMAFVGLDLRLALWQGDLASYRATLERRVDARPEHELFRVCGAAMLGEIGPEQFRDMAIRHSEGSASQRMISLALQWGCEVLCFKQEAELAMQLLERSADGALVDLSWVDLCPALDVLRGDQGFRSVRAKVAARAEAIWTL